MVLLRSLHIIAEDFDGLVSRQGSVWSGEFCLVAGIYLNGGREGVTFREWPHSTARYGLVQVRRSPAMLLNFLESEPNRTF